MKEQEAPSTVTPSHPTQNPLVGPRVSRLQGWVQEIGVTPEPTISPQIPHQAVRGRASTVQTAECPPCKSSELEALEVSRSQEKDTSPEPEAECNLRDTECIRKHETQCEDLGGQETQRNPKKTRDTPGTPGESNRTESEESALTVDTETYPDAGDTPRKKETEESQGGDGQQTLGAER